VGVGVGGHGCCCVWCGWGGELLGGWGLDLGGGFLVGFEGGIGGWLV